MNAFGRHLRLALFGESHGAGVGVVVDGLPPGLAIDLGALQRDLDARRPGTGPLVSQRREADRAQVLSGVRDGVATGSPVAVWIANEDAQSKPYADVARLPRPGHGDYPSTVWSHGNADLRGGGHGSGRMTAALVAAGSLAAMALSGTGITTGAHLQQVGEVAGPTLQAAAAMQGARSSPVRTAHAHLEAAFTQRIEAARQAGDSVGGVVGFAADRVPAGWGEPFFDSVEGLVAQLLFAVPAVKGVAFGAGFRAAAMAGSAHNDPFTVDGGRVATRTNNAGGILGGRTTGMPVWGEAAVKPTSSIFVEQDTVDLEAMAPAKLRLTGRHDPCVAVRAVPVVEACLRLALAELHLGRRA